MKIIANGEARQVDGGQTVGEFLVTCGWKPTQVVVEYNGKILPRSELGELVLLDNDRLEIIIPVAGG